jgi:ribonuclease BN (tRNA processing enzyme)
MKIKVLGCSGGIGDDRHTTSFLIDDDILMDAGTGITRLSREALARVDHVFLTHSHLDHILCLPLLLDSVAGERGRHALMLHALPEVLGILKDHLFNWRIWPDFSRIPSVESPFLIYAPIEIGKPVRVGSREFTAIPANHVVPAVGFLLRSETGSLIFSGDTASHTALWEVADDAKDLKHMFVECSFCAAQYKIARASKHYDTETLAADLVLMRPGPLVWVSHLKPGGEERILDELARLVPGGLQVLREGMEFEV